MHAPPESAATPAWQGSLFGSGPIAVDTAFAGLRRTQLASGAWVDHVQGWVGGADELFERLCERLPWRSREVVMYDRRLPEPRRTAWAPLGAAAGWSHELLDMAAALSEHYGHAFDSVGANLYRDGADSVAWHGDRHARRPDDPDAVVGILSLGTARRMLLRPLGGGRSVRFEPYAGDLLVLGGSCQRTWQHSIPKCAKAGPRISVTFRHPVSSPSRGGPDSVRPSTEIFRR